MNANPLGMKHESLSMNAEPQAAEKAIGTIADNLVFVGSDVRQKAKVILPPLGGLILNAKIEGALRRELELRKDTISKEIQTQKLVLELIADKSRGNLETIQNNQDQRLVYAPYLASKPIDNPDGWIAKRNSIRLMTLTVEGLAEANKISEEFNQGFISLLDGSLTIGRANAILSQIEKVITVAEELKKQSN